MSDIAERLRQGVDPDDIQETEAAMDRGADEIERLRGLLYRCQVAWIEDGSDLAAEVRAALEEKPTPAKKICPECGQRMREGDYCDHIPF